MRINTIFEDSGLAKNQIKIANTCGVLPSALVKVGIQALIDEETGFQYGRKNDALRYLLKQSMSSTDYMKTEKIIKNIKENQEETQEIDIEISILLPCF